MVGSECSAFGDNMDTISPEKLAPFSKILVPPLSLYWLGLQRNFEIAIRPAR